MKRINYSVVTAVVISVILIAIMLTLSILVLRKDIDKIYKDNMSANLTSYVEVLKRNADYICTNMYSIQEDMHDTTTVSHYYNNYSFIGRYFFDESTINPALTIQGQTDDDFVSCPGVASLKEEFLNNHIIFCKASDLFDESAIAIDNDVVLTSVGQKEMPEDYITEFDNYYYFIGQTTKQFFKGMSDYNIKSISFLTESLDTVYGKADISSVDLNENKVDLQYSDSSGLKLVMGTSPFNDRIKYIVNQDINFSKSSYFNSTVITVLSCFALMYIFFFAFYILNFKAKKRRLNFFKENVAEKQNVYFIKVDELGNIIYENNIFREHFNLQNIFEGGTWQKYFEGIVDMGTIVLKLKQTNGIFANVSFLVKKNKNHVISMYGTDKNNIKEYMEHEITYGAMENSSLSIYNFERLKEMYLSPGHKEGKLFALIKITNFERYEMLYGKDNVNEVKLQQLTKMNKILSPYGILYGSEIGTEYCFLITNKNKVREFINKVVQIFSELNKTIELNYQIYEMNVLGGIVIIDDALSDKSLDELMQLAGKALIKAQMDSEINYAIYYENHKEQLNDVLSRESILELCKNNSVGLRFYPIKSASGNSIDAYRVKYDLRTQLGEFKYEDFLLYVDTYGILKEFSKNILTHVMALYKGFAKNAKRPKFFLSMPLTHFLLLDFHKLSIITQDPNYEKGSFVIVFNDMVKNLGDDVLREKVKVVKSLGFGIGFLSEEFVVLSADFMAEKLVQYILISKKMYGTISNNGMDSTLIKCLVDYFKKGDVKIIAGHHSEEEFKFLKTVGIEHIQSGLDKDGLDMKQVWEQSLKGGINE